MRNYNTQINIGKLRPQTCIIISMEVSHSHNLLRKKKAKPRMKNMLQPPWSPFKLTCWMPQHLATRSILATLDWWETDDTEHVVPSIDQPEPGPPWLLPLAPLHYHQINQHTLSTKILISNPSKDFITTGEGLLISL